MRMADVKRNFGNKTTWDKPFEEHFVAFAREANRAVFDNGKVNKAINQNAIDIKNDFDLVYIDTPYISQRGVGVDYLAFYHFLEGLVDYENWANKIDFSTKHRQLHKQSNEWIDKKAIHQAFDKLFTRFKDSILAVSYRSDGIPSVDELVLLLQKYKADVQVHLFKEYKYVLSKNGQSDEVLIIGL